MLKENEKDQIYSSRLKEQIATLKKENRYLEFKANYQEAERLGKYISALSNGACLDGQDFAYLYFGVEDATLKVKGTSFDTSSVKAKGNQSLEIYLRQLVSPKINFTIDEFRYFGKERIVVFRIPAAKREPTTFMGKPYVRVDSHLTELTPYIEWMRTIYTSDSDWSAELVPNATLDDLDKDAIKLVREGYKLRFPYYAEEAEGWNDMVLLDKANLTQEGCITRATMLLVGKRECAHKIGNIAQIVWKCHQEDESFGDTFTIPFVKSTTELLNRIRNYQFKIYPKSSLIPVEVWKYDTRSILEALHNCIAHQDYTMNERIIVTEDKDKLSFENVGGFFEGDYTQYISGKKTPKRYRNPFLMKAMVNVKMIDSQGYGIHNMFTSQKKRYLPLPDYNDTTDTRVIMHLIGTIIDENYSLMLMDNTDIDLIETVLLDMVQKQRPIPSQAVALLRKKGLIEGRLPNIYVAKSVSRQTNKKAEYSKHKGLDMKSCETLLLSSLKDHVRLSRIEINDLLYPVLSNLLNDKQKKSKISYMLKKMCIKGEICNICRGKKSEYILSKIST